MKNLHLGYWKGSFADMRRLWTADPHPTNTRYVGNCQPEQEGPSWYGGIESMTQLDKLIDSGWSDGLKKYKDIRSALEKFELPESMNRRRRMRWCDDGDFLDEDRAMIGDPTAWRGAKRKFMTGPSVVDISFQWGALGCVNQKDLFWSGAAAIALADALEERGYATSITAVNVTESHSHGQGQLTAVTLKEPEDPLQVDLILVAAAHAGVFRTYGFRAKLEASCDMDGFGRTVTSNQKEYMLQVDPDSVPDGLIILDAQYSCEGALSTLKAAVKQLTGQLVRE